MCPWPKYACGGLVQMNIKGNGNFSKQLKSRHFSSSRSLGSLSISNIYQEKLFNHFYFVHWTNLPLTSTVTDLSNYRGAESIRAMWKLVPCTVPEGSYLHGVGFKFFSPAINYTPELVSFQRLNLVCTLLLRRGLLHCYFTSNYEVSRGVYMASVSQSLNDFVQSWSKYRACNRL